MPNCIDWDSEKVKLINELYLGEGYSAGMIARELEHRVGGRFSRNAVMGKIHRLKLHKDGAGKLPRVNARVDPNAAKPKYKRKWKPKPQPKPPQLVFDSPPTSGIACPCQLEELGAFNCHYPIGDPAKAGFYFCGAVVVPGKLYCPTHYQAAHNYRPEPRRPRRQPPRLIEAPDPLFPAFLLVADPAQAAFKGGCHEPT